MLLIIPFNASGALIPKSDRPSKDSIISVLSFNSDSLLRASVVFPCTKLLTMSVIYGSIDSAKLSVQSDKSISSDAIPSKVIWILLAVNWVKLLFPKFLEYHKLAILSKCASSGSIYNPLELMCSKNLI